MKEDTGSLNNLWAAVIIDLLVQQKVDYFCLSPGSRVTPLSIALANHPKAKTFVHFDERGSAFHALGYSKATGKPAAIVTTSGTAVGNIFPAVMEAALSHTPLIVITSDRPPELRDVSANQTVDQVKVFGNYSRFTVDLPTPTSSIPLSYLSSTIAQAVFISKQPPHSPVHLNCMFREPLFSEQETPLPNLHHFNYESCPAQPTESILSRWAENLSQFKKGLVLLGALSPQTNTTVIVALARKLGWPIFSDIFSGLRTDESVIAYYDLIIKSLPDLQIDTVLHLGDRYLSKTVFEWLQKVKPKRYFQVIGHPDRSDPAHLVTDKFVCDPELFCDHLLHFIPEKSSEWVEQWKSYDDLISEALNSLFTQEEKLTEPSLFHYLQQCAGNFAIFLANSMPVRDANLFLGKKKLGPIFGTRGVSGIDGNIATSVGLAQGLQHPFISIIGDQTFLHDLNSLAQMKNAKYPVILIVINNKGGGIFSFLPIAKKPELIDRFFAGAHDYTFESAAKLFDLPYYKVQNPKELAACIRNRSCLIEIETDRKENFDLHQEIYQQVELCLRSVSCMAF